MHRRGFSLRWAAVSSCVIRLLAPCRLTSRWNMHTVGSSSSPLGHWTTSSQSACSSIQTTTSASSGVTHANNCRPSLIRGHSAHTPHHSLPLIIRLISPQAVLYNRLFLSLRVSWRSEVCVSVDEVCVSVDDTGKPCKNGWTKVDPSTFNSHYKDVEKFNIESWQDTVEISKCAIVCKDSLSMFGTAAIFASSRCQNSGSNWWLTKNWTISGKPDVILKTGSATPPEEDRAMDTGKTRRKFGDIRSFASWDMHVNKVAYHDTPHPYHDGVRCCVFLQIKHSLGGSGPGCSNLLLWVSFWGSPGFVRQVDRLIRYDPDV